VYLTTSTASKPSASSRSAAAASAPAAAGFARFELGRDLERGLASLGFTAPRPIQESALPAALAGRDVLGLAPTGTGKTAAFGLPLLERLLAGDRADGPRALVLAPTRELASQIDAELRALARFTPLRTATVYGGVSAGRQISALRRRPDVVVACPGRLLDLLGQGALRLDRVEVLVLDEADHMFDMGFLPDIKRILAALPRHRQNLLFSATMPRAIRGLADAVLHEPHVVELAHARPAETIEHALYPVAEDRKRDLLERLLREEGLASAIVFTRTKHRAKRLAQQLERAGHRAVALQGNMSQSQRDRAMQGFRSRRFDVLVATDIAARGIDVSDVSQVVNFDVPNVAEHYTHRLGRTGRSECSGVARTFVTGADTAQVRAIEAMLGAPIARRRLEGFDAGAVADGPRGGGDAARPRAGRRRSRRGGSRPSGDRRGGARPGRRTRA